MKELIIQPTGGLGNRTRVIVAGLAIARKYDAKLTIIFKEGNLRDLIDLPEDIPVRKSLPQDFCDYVTYSGKKHDFSAALRILYRGCYRFLDMEDNASLVAFDYPEYIRPSAAVWECVKELERDLQLPDDFIGMHIRRGDHKRCKQLMPDIMVIFTIEKLIEENPAVNIVIACEDIPLREKLKSIYGRHISICTQKRTEWKARFYISAAIKDFAELLLLSRARYIIGTDYSSYSTMLIGFNGNPDSYQLGERPYRYREF